MKFTNIFRYEDGSGGCDGCLNWEGVGYMPPRALANLINKKPEWYRAFPITRKTNNNKLQLAARSLELMFTIPDWPPGAPSLTTSLKETGKSRFQILEIYLEGFFYQDKFQKNKWLKAFSHPIFFLSNPYDEGFRGFTL